MNLSANHGSSRRVMPGVRRFVVMKVKQLLIGFIFLIGVSVSGSSASNSPQGEVVPDGWKKVSACDISFLVPASMENLNARGIDSCVAAFGDSNMKLLIDYGRYGYVYKKHDPALDEELKGFKQQIIKVGGKRAQIVTYLDDSRDARNNPPLKYIAGMYVVVHTDKTEGIRTKISVNMTMEGRSEREQEIAKRIFRSVRFQ